MGHRLSKIVTRTGDAGTTGLGDGSRVAKDSVRIAAIGEIDELNSTVGLLLCEALPARRRAVPHRASSTICSTSAASCRFRATRAVTDAHVARLEDDVEAFNADLAPLKEFILPGRHPRGGDRARRAHRLPARRARARPHGGEPSR